MDYEKKYKEALELARDYYKANLKLDKTDENLILEDIFPELAESEDERIRKLCEILVRTCFMNELCTKEEKNDCIAWLENQQKPIINVPSREVILAIWDLGNEWKELTNGSVSTEYGTQLYYIQKHWHESEYYLQKKQGEQKSAEWYKGDEQNLNACLGYIPDEYLRRWLMDVIHVKYDKPTDKIEPKFHKGQWIVWQDKCYKVNYNGCGYELVDQNGLSILLDYGTIDENAHLWDVAKDAKDGDVLVDKDDNIGIYKEIEGICWHSYIYLGFDNYLYGFSIGGSHVQNNTKPATKEQRDTLMEAMADAGYTFDFDKKELKKIEKKFNVGDEIKTANEEPLAITKIDKKGYWSEDLFICDFDDAAKWELVEQKPAWSKEDEKIVLGIEQVMTCASFLNIVPDKIKKVKDWLKSLKERVQPQPKQEWGEEDWNYIADLISYFNGSSLQHDTPDVISWLKSFKPQNMWEPSDEQMKALRDLNLTGNISYAGQGQTLIELYNDLKKLKGE